MAWAFVFTTKAQSIYTEIDSVLARKTVDIEQIQSIFETKKHPIDSLAEAGYYYGTTFYSSQKDLALTFFKQAANTQSNLENYACRSGLMVAMTYLKYKDFAHGKMELNRFLKSNCDSGLKAVAEVELGILYENKGQYYTALSLFEEANSTLDTIPKYQVYSIKADYSLGNIYSFLNNPKEAIQHYTNGINRLAKYPNRNNTEYIKLIIGRAQEFESLGQFDKSMQDYNTAIELSKRFEFDTYYLHSLDQLGLLYSKMGKTQLALQHFDQVIKATENANNEFLFSAQANKADLLYKLGKTEQSTALYQSAINHFLTINNEQPDKISPVGLSIGNKEVLLQLLQGYLNIIPKDKSNQSEVKQLTNLLDDVAIQTLSFSDSQSIYKWRNKVKPVYGAAIRYYAAIKDAKQVFELIERSKASVLFFEIQQNKYSSEHPQLSALRNKLLQLDESLQTKQYETDNTLSQTEIQLQMQELKDSIQKFVFANYRYNVFGTIDLQEVQDKITENQSVYNYFVDDEELIGMVITKAGAEVFVRANNDLFELPQFIQDIRKPFSSKSQLVSFQQRANELTDLLLPNLKTEAIILPDGLLNYIPFDCLQQNGQFLIQDYCFSYGFSANTYFLEEQQKKSRKNKAYGFAPIQYVDSLNLSPLNYSLEELSMLKKYPHHFDISTYAIGSNFESFAPISSLIHISSHGSGDEAQNELPWIASYNQKIYLPEIYQLKLQADLVVLSACETNLGKQIMGEGVLSLARGFYQSGANSVVASQWNVNESATATILTSFYQLVNRNSKATALQQAKNEYIKNNPNLAQSPYYWAGLIYYGQNSPLSLQRKPNTLLYFVLITSFILVVSYSIKKKRKSHD